MTGPSPDPADEAQTPGDPVDRAVRDCVQELLKSGVLEAVRKPNLYRTAVVEAAAIAAILAPLDLDMGLDEIRGLAFVRVIDGYDDGDREQWSHPLVRRQRLNLEQSLLVAILRRFYVAHEIDAGIGNEAAIVHLDQLLPELNHFLGETGSDRQDDKRLRLLLEQLRGHGLVSEADANEQLRVRPLIVHVANPANLQALLAVLGREAEAQNKDQGQKQRGTGR
jgi:hypothetical protein